MANNLPSYYPEYENPKLEARNPKQNSRIQIQMTKTAGAKVPFWILEHSNFEFVSSFGLPRRDVMGSL
jgi:hypothetical protein